MLACWAANLDVRHGGCYCAVGRFDDDDGRVKGDADNDPCDACVFFIEIALLRHVFASKSCDGVVFPAISTWLTHIHIIHCSIRST